MPQAALTERPGPNRDRARLALLAALRTLRATRPRSARRGGVGILPHQRWFAAAHSGPLRSRALSAHDPRQLVSAESVGRTQAAEVSEPRPSRRTHRTRSPVAARCKERRSAAPRRRASPQIPERNPGARVSYLEIIVPWPGAMNYAELRKGDLVAVSGLIERNEFCNSDGRRKARTSNRHGWVERLI